MSEFERLIQQVRVDDSEDAVRMLVERYGSKILRTIRRRLPPHLRRAFDAEDFVQSAYRVVFADRSRVEQFKAPEELASFVAAIAKNKLKMMMRRRDSGRPDDWRHDVELANLSESNLANALFCAPAQTPSQVVAAKEHWQQVLGERPDFHRTILTMRREGYSHREIGDAVGRHEDVVRRILRNIGNDCDRKERPE